IVIDTLSAGGEWNEKQFNAIKPSGYTGIQTSLNNRGLKVAMDDLVDWQGRIANNPDTLLQVGKTEDFLTAKREGKLAVMLGFQNGTIFEDDVDNVDILYKLGTRCVQLTYNSRNLIGDGCTERTNAGLSDFGVDVVHRMNKLGMIVDLSHCGKQTSYDGIELSKSPAAFTHTFCESIYKDHPRAKTDDQLKHVAEKGGMVGIAALGYFVGPDPDGATTIETYVDHVEHALNICGEDHVGICTDFALQGLSPWATRENWYEPRLKMFDPSYQVRWPPYIMELDVPERFLNVTQILKDRGHSEAKIEKILGLNWIKYFREVIG
ncbi:MAG: dipeptidase, partial [Sphingomonadales bacterium]